MPRASTAGRSPTCWRRSSGVGVEHATAPDGAPVARVRVRLDRAAKHRVRSARNTILVEIDRGDAAACASAKAPMPDDRAGAAGGAKAPARGAGEGRRSGGGKARGRDGSCARCASRRSTTAIRSRSPATARCVAAKVEEAKDLPPRVLLDFNGVAAGSAPAVTNIKNDDIDRIRVATNSREPLITRVVIDLARKLPYTVEQIGDELRVLFRRAVDTAAAAVTPARRPRPVKIDEPVDSRAGRRNADRCARCTATSPVARPVPPCTSPPVNCAPAPAAPPPAHRCTAVDAVAARR